MKKEIFTFQVKNLQLNDLEAIKKFKEENKDKVLKVLINNTRYINTDIARELLEYKDLYIQVIGPHDKKYADLFNNEQYTKSQNIYTPFEFYCIIEQIEAIEETINMNLKPLPKVFLIYDYLRSNYDVRYDKDLVDDLRALITGETTSFGLALILKEFLDRHKIPNTLIQSKDVYNAFNLIKIGKYYYLLNIGSDAYSYSKNIYADIKYFSNFNKEVFLKKFPLHPEEQIKNLNMVTILSDKTINILKGLTQQQKTASRYLILNREDGSRIILLEIKKDQYMPKDLNRYLVADLYKDNRIANLKAFYSKTKFFELDKEIIDNLANTILNRKRLESHYKDKKYNIGYLDISNNDMKIIDDLDEYTSNIKMKTFKKTEFSSIVLEKTYEANVIFYNYMELYFDEKTADFSVFQSEIITDNDLFIFQGNDLKKVSNSFLKLENVSRRVHYLDGYMGYCDPKKY